MLNLGDPSFLGNHDRLTEGYLLGKTCWITSKQEVRLPKFNPILFRLH